MTAYGFNAYSAQIAVPTKAYGIPAVLPLRTTTKTGHMRVAIPNDIPDDAVVLTAELVFTILEGWAGTRTATARRHATMPQFSGITWNKRPAVTGTTFSVDITDPASGDTFAIPVNTDAQGIITGGVENTGWQLGATGGDIIVAGSRAAQGMPYLNLVYVVPGEAPSDLMPHGRIATGNPTLTFTLPEGATHVQVEVGTLEDMDSGGIVYDSGMLTAETGGVFELTGYTIPDNATRYIRTQAWVNGVETGWSPVSEVIRDDIAALAIIAPGATSPSAEPTVEWTMTGQVAWRAWLYDHALGRVAADSGRVVGTEHEWTPPAGVRGEGTATWHVEGYDDKEDRVPTPGVDVYASDSHTFEVNAGGADDGPTDLTVTQRGATPIQDLEWTWAVPLGVGYKAQIIRTVAGEPAEWLAQVAGNVLQYADRTAPRYKNVTYKVVPVDAAGTIGTTGPSELVFPASVGIWLLDPSVPFADTEAAVLIGADQGTQVMEEQTVEHAVNNRQTVRRRVGLVPPKGDQTGFVMDVLGVTADETYARLMAWKKADPSKEFRLVMGSLNMPVTIGNVFAFPTPDSTADEQYVASFSWWHTDDELPWG